MRNRMIGAALAVLLGFAITACERVVDKPAVEKSPEPAASEAELAVKDTIWLTDENRVKTDMPVGLVPASSKASEAEALFGITWTVQGYLEANTTSVYQVTVHQAGRLTARTTGAGPDTYGYIKDSEGVTLVEDDDGGVGVNFSVTAQIVAGDYQIWVEGYSPSASGSYVLRVDFTSGGGAPPPGDDHGNTRSTATSVAVPSSTAGTLTAGDVDYFTVTVSQPGTLTVNTSGSTDTYGTLEDASGSTLAIDDDGGSGTNFRLSSVVSAGTYYAKVSGYSGSTTGDYRLHVTFIPGGDDHGNTRSTATSVAAPSSTAGTLTAGDVDYFTVTVSQPGTLTVNTSGTTDTYGTLEDASGGTLATNDDGGSGTNFRLSSAVSAGTYYVRVAGYNSATTGSYTLTLQFGSRPPPTSEFDIEIWAIPGVVTGRLESAIFDAVRFWESAIIGDLQNVRISRADGDCPSPSLVGETIDDLAILVRVRPIDGPSGTLAQAGPCTLRRSKLPVVGEMVFDVDDVSRMSQQALNVIAVHEMAHVLGFGTLWGRFYFNLLRLPSIVGNRPVPGQDTYFTGRRAIAAFDRLGGRSYLGNKVPVENDTTIFEQGALDSHWRESVFGNENMTPSIGPGSNPVSILTIESFADLGYQVNTSAAEPYRLTRAASSSESELIILENDILEGPVTVIDREGNVVEVIGSPSMRAVSSPSVEYVRVKER